MNDTSNAGGEFKDLAELVDASFPGLKCLRCGHEAFFLASDVNALAASGGENRRSVLALQSAVADPKHARNPVLTLACMRCGHLEQHLTGMLTKAAKPIPDERR
jgi:ribosomal protein L37E